MLGIAVRTPLVAALVAGVWLHGLFSMLGVYAAAAGLVAGLVGWRVLHAGSFRRVVAWPVIAWWRRYFVHGREWPELMATLGLSTTHRGEDRVPELRGAGLRRHAPGLDR
ncbi:MAG: hypothetical protein ACRDQA_03435 [Nocardioidaceae bacterium]